MIRVVISLSNHQITSFQISGHAGSGPYGYDLVCAGVSAVSFGAVNAVHELSGVELNIRQGSEDGYLYAGIPSDLLHKQMEKIQLLLQGMIVSLRTIEREYSEFIQIQER